MQIKRIMLMPGVYLTGITTDKFKTSCLSLNLLRPLCREEASLNALLPDVLLRGCGHQLSEQQETGRLPADPEQPIRMRGRMLWQN